MEIEVQAGRWLARLLEPDCTAAERAACARWRAQSPEHDATYRGMEAMWQRSAGIGADPAIAAALRDAERQPAPRSRARRWLPPLALAAVLAAATLAATQWLPMRQPAVELPYRTALGEQRRIELPDGTAVVLDTDTALVARYARRQRLVELEAGQARFEVMPDARRPFVVQAAGGRVTAVGTQFQVRVEDAAATVTLLEGAVVVKAPEGAPGRHPPATLSPGQELRFDRDGQWTTTRVDLQSADAWTEGHLFATDWPLDRLVAEMNRYSTTKLRLSDPALADLRVNGGFRTGDPHSLVLVLEHSLPVRVAETGEDEIVLSPRPAERH